LDELPLILAEKELTLLSAPGNDLMKKYSVTMRRKTMRPSSKDQLSSAWLAILSSKPASDPE
jgi:hypothetical protein